MHRLFCLILLLFPATLAAQAKKLPLPSPEDQRKAEEDIKSIFKEDLKKKDRASKAELSKKLLEQAKDASNTPTSRYVLLLQAKTVAVEGFDFKTAFEAMDRLYDIYELPFPTLTGATFTVPINAHKVEILNICRKKANSPSDLNEISEIYLSIAEDCQKKMEYEDAASSADLASKTTKDREIAMRARGVIQEISKQKEELAKVRKAEDVLSGNPKDPEANETVGLYECFVKGDWKGGCLKLFKSSNPSLKAIAEKELDASGKVEAQMELAEAWSKLGTIEKNPIRKRKYQERTDYWLGQASVKATGLERVKVQNKINELKAGIEPDVKGLLVHLKFSEGTGTTAKDYSGNGHHAVFNGGVTWHSDSFGKSVKFDGSTGYIDIQNPEAVSSGVPQTVAWKQYVPEPLPAADGSGQVVWGIANVGSGSTTMASVISDTLVVGNWRSGSSLSYTRLNAYGQWHSCVYTYDGKENRLYVDGMLKSTLKEIPDHAKATRIELGRWGGGGTPIRSYFSGRLMDFRIYDRILTEMEISLLSKLR